MTRRKIIVVDTCMDCPLFSKAYLRCWKLDLEPPIQVITSGLIWDKCPLDDAEGFL